MTLSPQWLDELRARTVLSAVIARRSGGSSGSDHVMRGSFGYVVLPLVAYGVAPDDIWVYDVTHAWHDGRMAPRFVNGVLGAFLLEHPAGELRPSR